MRRQRQRPADAANYVMPLLMMLQASCSLECPHVAARPSNIGSRPLASLVDCETSRRPLEEGFVVAGAGSMPIPGPPLDRRRPRPRPTRPRRRTPARARCRPRSCPTRSGRPERGAGSTFRPGRRRRHRRPGGGRRGRDPRVEEGPGRCSVPRCTMRFVRVRDCVDPPGRPAPSTRTSRVRPTCAAERWVEIRVCRSTRRSKRSCTTSFGTWSGEGRRARPRPRRVLERVRGVEAGGLDDAQGAAEVLLGLAGEPDDDVGGHRDLGDGLADPVQPREVAVAPIRAAHRVQDPVRAGLEREVDVLAHRGVSAMASRTSGVKSCGCGLVNRTRRMPSTAPTSRRSRRTAGGGSSPAPSCRGRRCSRSARGG